MYEESPTFKQPENENVRIWRYMDFTKLVSLIESQCLYFTRADRFDDPFEGSWPKINVNARKDIFLDFTKENQEAYIKMISLVGNISQLLTKHQAINCWHMNEHESAAMWKLYLKSNEGIAIQSTYLKLRESITDNEKVFLGVVKYIDYEKEPIDANSMISAFVYKRKSFEHEREIRAIVTKAPPSDGKNGIDFNKETITHGIKIKVDIERLIEKIYVAPNAPNWFSELVSSIVQHYGYNFTVVHSKLSEQPLF